MGANVIIMNLGVVDIPYTSQFYSTNKKGVVHKNPTVGDVAEILENKYHIMELFFEVNKQEIAGYLENALTGAIQNLMLGAPQSGNILAGAESHIKKRFSQFLSMKEMDNLGYPGIPTAASLAGSSSRRKIRSGPVRPSFIDTGLYEASFLAWTS